MALSLRQQRLYTDAVTIYRRTTPLSGPGKPQAATGAVVATAVPCYIQTGESVKAPVVFINSEQDNMFTYDLFHFEAGTDLKTGDILLVTAGAQTGDYFHVRGDEKERSRRANKQSYRCSREPSAPTWIP